MVPNRGNASLMLRLWLGILLVHSRLCQAQADDEALAITVEDSIIHILAEDLALPSGTLASSLEATIQRLSSDQANQQTTITTLQASISEGLAVAQSNYGQLSTDIVQGLSSVGNDIDALRASLEDATEPLENAVGELSNQLQGTVGQLTSAISTAKVEAVASAEDIATQADAELSEAIVGHVSELQAAISTTQAMVAQAFNTLSTEVRAQVSDAAASLETKISEVSLVGQDLECNSQNEGRVRINMETGEVETCVRYESSYSWLSSRFMRDGSSEDLAAASCKQVLQVRTALGRTIASGKYWVDAGTKTTQVWCEMSADGGGWTLVGYAGRIQGNKRNTVKTGNYLPLFHTFGNYDADATSTRSSFSWLQRDEFEKLFKDNSDLMARRTAVPNKQMIWPIASTNAWKNRYLPDIPHIVLSQDGKTYVKRSPINIYRRGCQVPCWTGYDWNMCGSSLSCESSNCDNCGGWSSQISHRALLYWEINDDGYPATQWFHGTPLDLSRSSNAQNTVQDIEFYIREAGDYV